MILKEKKTIITGGSGGIGQAIAAAFLKEGAEVMLVARDKKKLEQAKKSLNSSKIFVCVADISDPKGVKKIISHVKKNWGGRVHTLVNAAGVYGPKALLENLDEKEWFEVLRINLFGTMLMCKYFIPLMKKQKTGVIINFSGGGEEGFPRFTAYASSKGAVVRFTESLAREVEGAGLRVNAIAPGAVNTGLLEEVLKAGPDKAGKEFYERSLKQKKEGGVLPDRAARLCVFLASDKSRGLNGKVISAVWDDWRDFPAHMADIKRSDIYNFRRIKPKDRGYDWK